ncbi:hypothetical protein PY093_11975 [Cytobacillus sp. S13-E01]|uniref:hypothetical protein n=1 Tax=Cytobacillus sp. S13-E01 TaxID=3031326 RepID=UPI0023D89A9D|nr:hypothetical protein [Cytobacillus sp. S13-E01]MDF0727405.1 hypothetical protein [Cytobacillus sp. S13-E01]
MYQRPYFIQNPRKYPTTYTTHNYASQQPMPLPYIPYSQQINYQGIYYPVQRQYPEVDPTLFNESARQMQILMNEASIVLKRIAESKSFAKKVMSAAQDSQLEEVERLIKTTGITSKVETAFNPDGINMKLTSKIDDTECCQLTIALKWRNF